MPLWRNRLWGSIRHSDGVWEREGQLSRPNVLRLWRHRLRLSPFGNMRSLFELA